MRLIHLGAAAYREKSRCVAQGVPFGDLSCVHRRGATWDDVTTGGTTVTLSVAVDGLAAGTLYRWRSRALYAPFGVTQAGIAPPPNPKHGPWRRFLGQAQEADLRVGLVYVLSVSISGDGSVTSAPVGIKLRHRLHGEYRRRRSSDTFAYREGMDDVRGLGWCVQRDEFLRGNDGWDKARNG